jgi:hypothetical protein
MSSAQMRTPLSVETLAAQLGAMERAYTARLAEVERANEALRAEVTQLRTASSALAAGSAAPAAPPIPPAQPRGRRAADDAARGRATSRRRLLRLGGAAAAAGVAVAAGTLTGRAPIARAAAELDSNYVQMGVNYPNYCATGTFLQPVSLSSPVTLLDVNNQSTLTFDTLHACGVKGSGPSGGNGVIGFASGVGSKGIWGQSDSGIGVLAQSGTGYDVWLGGTGRLYQQPQGSAGAPTSGDHFPGEQVRDVNGELWICVGAGTPGTWRKVAAPQAGYAGGALNFLPVPIRLLDTRAGATVGNTRPGAPVAYHGTINVPAAGVTYSGQTIPSGAVAVFGLLTAALAPGVNPGDGSSAIAYATGATRPAAINVIFNPQDLHGAYTANFTLVQCGTSGDFSIYSQPINPAAVDYLFDCFGFVM